MKKVPAILFFIFILSSCGGGLSSLTITTGNISTQLTEIRALSANERNIATRICYAYQSKSKDFRSSTYLGANFQFGLSYTDCSKAVQTSNSTVMLRLNEAMIPEFSAAQVSTLSVIPKIQTDTNGFLSQLCDKIKTNSEIYNTVDIGSSRVQVSFFQDQLDGYYLKYFTMNSKGQSQISSIDMYKVRTQFNYTTGQILGMDEYISKQNICVTNSSTITFSNFEQKFISKQ